jgi:hypothetical protein
MEILYDLFYYFGNLNEKFFYGGTWVIDEELIDGRERNRGKLSVM